MVIPLPFVVQPRQKPTKIKIGNEDAGVLEIERYGYLTAGEKAAFQQVETNKNGGLLMQRLVSKIEKETKIPHSQILTDFSVLEANKELPEYLNPYLEELLEVFNAFAADTEHMNVVKATVMLVSRVSPDITFEQSMALHPDLLSALSELYDLEEARSTAALPSEYATLTKEENESRSLTSAAKAAVSGAKGKGKAQT